MYLMSMAGNRSVTWSIQISFQSFSFKLESEANSHHFYRGPDTVPVALLFSCGYSAVTLSALSALLCVRSAHVSVMPSSGRLWWQTDFLKTEWVFGTANDKTSSRKLEIGKSLSSGSGAARVAYDGDDDGNDDDNHTVGRGGGKRQESCTVSCKSEETTPRSPTRQLSEKSKIAFASGSSSRGFGAKRESSMCCWLKTGVDGRGAFPDSGRPDQKLDRSNKHLMLSARARAREPSSSRSLFSSCASALCHLSTPSFFLSLSHFLSLFLSPSFLFFLLLSLSSYLFCFASE